MVGELLVDGVPVVPLGVVVEGARVPVAPADDPAVVPVPVVPVLPTFCP
jgi:hypothetical protein